TIYQILATFGDNPRRLSGDWEIGLSWADSITGLAKWIPPIIVNFLFLHDLHALHGLKIRLFTSASSLLAQRKVCKRKGAPQPSASLAGTLFSARAETRLFFCTDALNLVCSDSLPASSD
ncbi:MAG: hypothetical protein SWH68_13950, partial [Thermodesulfobacteriota bacterium]|nr:hypothetical protein [Thermodesulfobacteriota bacterium]